MKTIELTEEERKSLTELIEIHMKESYDIMEEHPDYEALLNSILDKLG